MIEFKGTLSPELYARALRIHGASSPWLGILLLAAGVGGIATAAELANPETWGIPLAVAALGVFLLIYPRLIASRAFRTNALLRDGFNGCASESEFVAESPNGRSHISWDKFYRAVVTRDLVLLYVSAQQFLILPRAFVADNSDWANFQTLVSQRVPLKHRGRALLKVAALWLAIIVCIFLLLSLANVPE